MPPPENDIDQQVRQLFHSTRRALLGPWHFEGNVVVRAEASELNVKLSNRLSVRKDVPPAPGAPTLDKVKLVNYDRAWATDNKERLIKKWQSAVGL